jgi:mono/diheme cytochrome c family protein
MTRAPLLVLLLAVVPAAACEDDPTLPNYEYMPDMVSSVPFDSFDPNPNTADGRTLMKPPEGTIPRGYQPLHYAPGPAEAQRAGRELTNPTPDSDLTRARGEVAFQRWCSPCHGHEGLGDGLVARKFPRPPPLGADHARGLPDGQIFHIISFGQGVMPSYGQQVVAADRWKIVRYLRKLQAASGPVASAAPPAPSSPAPPALAAPTTGGAK